MSCECDCHRDRPGDPCHDCCDYGDKRISKAREMLKEAVKRECGTFETRYYYDEIKSALEALEGK